MHMPAPVASLPPFLVQEVLLPALQQGGVVSKVARWDPNKRWLMAVEMVVAMKQLGWRALLIARDGVDAHGAEVLAAAAGGLSIAEGGCPKGGVRGLLRVLEPVEGVDIVSLVSPLDAGSCQLLFHSAAAVLANSAHEPFGLVGLETTDPQEFLGLFAALRANPLRAAGPLAQAARQRSAIPRSSLSTVSSGVHCSSWPHQCPL
jgi:hypothetical protein